MTKWTEEDLRAYEARQRRPAPLLRAMVEATNQAFSAQPLPKKRQKFGNKKTIMGDRVFASGHEARRYAELELMEKAGQIRNLQRQVPYDMVVNGQHICTYIADAVYELDICAGDNRHALATDHDRWNVVVEDAKSEPTRKKPDYRIKVKLMAACHQITVEEIL